MSHYGAHIMGEGVHLHAHVYSALAQRCITAGQPSWLCMLYMGSCVALCKPFALLCSSSKSTNVQIQQQRLYLCRPGTRRPLLSSPRSGLQPPTKSMIARALSPAICGLRRGCSPPGRRCGLSRCPPVSRRRRSFAYEACGPWSARSGFVHEDHGPFYPS